MFETYFSPPDNSAKEILSCKRLDGSEQEQMVSQYMMFDKEKFLTEIAERINASNISGITYPKTDPSASIRNVCSMGLNVFRCQLYNKNTICFYIQIDPTIDIVIKALNEINFGFYYINTEKNFRFDLKPYDYPQPYKPLVPPQPDINLCGIERIWVFTVTKLDTKE